MITSMLIDQQTGESFEILEAGAMFAPGQCFEHKGVTREVDAVVFQTLVAGKNCNLIQKIYLA